MSDRPTLKTERLVLRPFVIADAPEVKRIAGDEEVASTTCNLPHPYEDGMAEEWIGKHEDQFAKGQEVTLAITHRQHRYLIGSIGLKLNKRFEHAELGYLVGKAFWNNGYCTEAAHAVLGYAFDAQKLNRVIAHHFLRNPASGRVMAKAGMRKEGLLRQHVKKNDGFEDIVCYGILRNEYNNSKSNNG